MKITERKLRSIIKNVIQESMHDIDITANPGSAEFQDTHDPRHKDFDHASSAEDHPFLEIFEQMCAAWMNCDSIERSKIQKSAQVLLDESEKDVATFRMILKDSCPLEALEAILPRDFYWKNKKLHGKSKTSFLLVFLYLQKDMSIWRSRVYTQQVTIRFIKNRIYL